MSFLLCIELSAIDNVNADAEVELSPPLASSSPGKSDSSGTQQARQGKICCASSLSHQTLCKHWDIFT